MRFGAFISASFSMSTLTGACSSVTRSLLTFAGYGPYCASLNSNLLYCTISVPPFLHVVEQPRVVGAQIGAPLVGAHAGDDGVEAREVAPREIVGA